MMLNSFEKCLFIPFWKKWLFIPWYWFVEDVLLELYWLYLIMHGWLWKFIGTDFGPEAGI